MCDFSPHEAYVIVKQTAEDTVAEISAKAHTSAELRLLHRRDRNAIRLSAVLGKGRYTVMKLKGPGDRSAFLASPGTNAFRLDDGRTITMCLKPAIGLAPSDQRRIEFVDAGTQADRDDPLYLPFAQASGGTGNADMIVEC